MQQSLFNEQYDNTPQQLDMQDADVRYYPYFIQENLATELMHVLQTSLSWRQEHITLYGKTFGVPRLQAWYGDEGANYQYSNMSLTPQPWTKELWALKQQCEAVAQTSFNSVLANLYRTGQDSMGRHADNETELGVRPVIASLNFGQTRNLDFYHNQTKQKVRIPLIHGSLLVMQGSTQDYWQHSVAKTKQASTARINLTYRKVYPSAT